jgi:thiamine-phosphate pyrophosphorylase
MAKRISGLYAVTPETPDTDALVAKVRAALRGGAATIQYRNKTLDAVLRRAQAEAIAKLCRDAGTCFIVNDSPVLAYEVDADGVHLGRDDGDIGLARGLLGRDRLVGVSCYNNIEIARQAVATGASYVAFGSFFISGTKPSAVRADPGLLLSARMELPVPLVAIGGIRLENAQELLDAGADALAVVSALFDADDVEGEARKWSGLFRRRTKLEIDHEIEKRIPL